MIIDWGKEIRELVDMGSESYERKVTRIFLKAAAIVLFVVVAWKLIQR